MRKKNADHVEIVGADVNNLSDVDTAFPRKALTAIVGVSGSGKSSLVEETLAAEGASRMRRFLDIDPGGVGDQPQRAYVGSLPPMLFAGQGAFRASSRTTLATCTGILRLFRRLFLKFGRPYASEVDGFVPDPSPEVFARWLKAHATGPAIVWAVPVLNQAVDGAAGARRLKAAGLNTVVLRSETDRGKAAETGKLIELRRFKPLRSDVRHTLEAEVGRFDLERVGLSELNEALAIAWEAAPNGVFVELPACQRIELRGAYSFGLDARVHMIHPESPNVYVRPNQHLLTFNAPDHFQSGACPACLGLGVATTLDESLLIAHPSRSMHDGAMAIWTEKNYRYVNIQHETIEGLRGQVGFDPDRPWKSLPSSARELILGGAQEHVADRDLKTRKKVSAPHSYPGFRRAILERAGKPTPAGDALLKYVTRGTCHVCGGSRWSAQARALRFADRPIDEVLGLPVVELALATESKGGSLSKRAPRDALGLVSQVHRIASALVDVGLGHLSGDRGMLDVSDGESRRVPLAGVLGSRLQGLLLVLDEPARGLHEQDLVSLGNALREASRLHTVVMSEHRARLVARADHLIELGPGAGSEGGRVIADGNVRGTGWARAIRVPLEGEQRAAQWRWLELTGIEIHNVRRQSVKIPLGSLSCIAGVSGSGKSSFVRGALVPALVEALPKNAVDVEDFRIRRGAWRTLAGAQHVKSLHALDQAPAAAHRRSIIATYLGVADALRRAFAAQPTAKALELSASDFSTNGGRGRCPRCLGLGRLADHTECPVCGGLRFRTEVLAVRVAGLSMADVLAEPLASLRLHDIAKQVEMPVLSSTLDLGVGYLSLGRSLDTLSGGEIQRLRVARALAKPDASGALFVLDEPAGGLHPKDVKQLLSALRHMVADGKNTVVLVEHDPYLLASCDYIVEFGPEGGPKGGEVVAAGAPGAIVKCKTATGRALAGKEGPGSARNLKSNPDTSHASGPPTRASALRARAELRQVTGEDVVVPDDDDRLAHPAVMFANVDTPVRPHELAGLDLELASVLLDALPPADGDVLIERWRNNSSYSLQICPFVDAIATWGKDIPRSVVAETSAQVLEMGLAPKIPKEADPHTVRVSGSRFAPRDPAVTGLRSALRDALVLGGGYAELVDGKGRAAATVCTRLMDLSGGLVGPRHPSPAHFSRSHPEGRCPMCSGDGFVWTIDTALVVKKRSGKLNDSRALVAQAAAVMRGVWHSELGPFFQRLTSEGLWDDKLTWSGLSRSQEAIVLYGFWTRPGHGTFLKVGRDNDGSEVRHWLRWDGLVAAVMSQLDRSRHSGWVEQVRASRKRMACPSCDATGLGPTARLLSLGDRNLYDWTRAGTLDSFTAALTKLTPLPARAKLRRERLLACLQPFRSARAPLRQPAEDPARSATLAQCAALFTGMQVAPE